MAQQGVELNQEQFCCSICLDLLKDPVTVPCGHSYCRTCIEGYWNQDDQRGRYSCPQCRQSFIPRPVLKKNTMLAEVVESLKKTGIKAAPPDHYYAGPGDVSCDVCTGRRLKAVKTCLQCLVSYCDTHLHPHYQSPAFKKHKLVKVSSKLQENVCSRHNRVNELFCRTDQQCICSLCSVEEHKGHDTTSAAAERTERQKELHMGQKNIQQRIQESEKDLKVLHQEVESINDCADEAVEDSEDIFTEFIRAMERRRTESRQLIRGQQKRELSRAEELRRRVEQEVTELRRRHAELEQLSLTEDHIHFLQRYTTSLSANSETTHSVSSHACPLRYFEDVTAAMCMMREELKDTLTEEWTNVSKALNTDVSPEPKTRDEFLLYSRPITLDPNTVNQRLSLSKGNRKVTVMAGPQSHPDHPERFTGVWQVLSREALTGRCYWEVELSGYCGRIAVSHKDISRTVDGECGFGSNDKSWSLGCTEQGYSFIHSGVTTDIPGPVSPRVGVYLNPSAGILSFYSVSDTMTLLHTVHTTFTQNLHAGLWLYSSPGDSAELCALYQVYLTEDPKDVTVALSNTTEQQLEGTLAGEGTNVSETVNRAEASLWTPPQPRTRAEFLQYARPITLDPNTASHMLSLSKGNRKATHMNAPQPYPDHPERFVPAYQVLSREALSGRWYTEVEWSVFAVGIALAYKDIQRTHMWSPTTGFGDDEKSWVLCGFGHNDKSWALWCTDFENRLPEEDFPEALKVQVNPGVLHNGHKDEIWTEHYPLYTLLPPRIGVYLDHSAGILSYYSTEDGDMTLIHRTRTTFTQNLHVGFFLHQPGNTAELCDLS